MYPTAAADVYSLGLILYEILAGENPLARVGLETLAASANERFRELQLKARVEGLPPLSDYEHPDRPRGERLADHPLLLEIVDRCLCFKASQRYDNAVALLRAVEDCAAGRGIVILPSEEEKQEDVPKLSLDRLLVEVQALLRQSRTEDARARCEQARRQFSQSGKPYRWLAEILLAEDKNKWQEAVRICADGRGVDPNEPGLCETAAKAYDIGDQHEAAIQMRKIAMRLREKSRK
jgi:serine/threonine protein kinase